MATILKGNSFTIHPAGTFMAVCADVYTKVFPNKYKGTIIQFGKNKGKPDTRETLEKACFVFLTTEPIEVDGELKPSYASFWASASMGSVDNPSNARKFLKGWWPTLTDAQIDAGFDLDKLIGKGAYLTITHSDDGKWANVVGAMQPPEGITIPMIPVDFVRHDEKEAQKAQAEKASTTESDKVNIADAAPVDMDDLPF